MYKYNIFFLSPSTYIVNSFKHDSLKDSGANDGILKKNPKWPN
jgi:hypothetical protein